MSSSVDEVRRQIDTLDNNIHDMLMQRAELVLKIGEEKRRNNIQVVQPDREIVMLRRILNRHKGPLPREAIVRIWRELVGAVSLLQTGLKVVVTAPEDASGITYWDMAKDYFSSVLPMARVNTDINALVNVREGDATFAVLPWPEDGSEKPWWQHLMDEGDQRPLRIVARLPLGDRNREPVNPDNQALVVARLRVDPSGEDRTFIALDLPHAVSRARIIDKSKELKLVPLTLYSSQQKAGVRTLHMLEVENFVRTGDKILTDLLEKLDAGGSRAIVVGGYPVPPLYEDKVGKSVEKSDGRTLKKKA